MSSALIVTLSEARFTGRGSPKGDESKDDNGRCAITMAWIADASHPPRLPCRQMGHDPAEVAEAESGVMTRHRSFSRASLKGTITANVILSEEPEGRQVEG